jgi:hypothetical protein
LAYSVIAGLYFKTDPDCTGYAQRQNWTQHNSWVHDNVFDHCGDEGMYVGSSKYTGEDTQCSGVTIYPADLWNCQIYRNMSWYAGYDGIQVACARKGSSIHDNKVFYAGQKDTPSQCTGFIIGGGDSCDVYNNYAYKCKEDSYDVMLSAGNFYNNEAWYSGWTGTNTNIDGIFEKDVATVPGASINFINNLIVGAKTVGIVTQSSLSANDLIENNIIVGITSGTYIQNYYSNTINRNNYTNSSIASVQFSDSLGNIASTSPVINVGYAPPSFISTDFFGNPRVMGGTVDIGAVEYQSGTPPPVSPPATPGAITGSATQCSGNTGQVYSISAVPTATSYTWTVPSGWTITSGQGTVAITANVGSSGNIYVTANNSGGSSYPAGLIVTVTTIPATPGTISGSSSVLPATSNIYSIVSVSGATSYVWNVPTGWTINSGQGSITVTVTSGSVGQNGNITVSSSNLCGTSTAKTFAVTVSGQAPATPTLVTGNNNPCHNSSGNAYTVNTVLYATSYTWTVPIGWSIKAGQNTKTITVTAGNNGQNGNITVKAVNSYGTSGIYSYPVTTNLCNCSCPH